MASKHGAKGKNWFQNNLIVYFELIKTPLVIFAVFCIASNLMPIAFFLNMLVLFALAYNMGGNIVRQRDGTVENAAKAGVVFGLAAGIFYALMTIVVGYIAMQALGQIIGGPGHLTNGSDTQIAAAAGRIQGLTTSMLLASVIMGAVIVPIASAVIGVIASVIGATSAKK